MNAMIDSVLAPLEWVVAWLMVGFHTIFTAIGLPPEAGFTCCRCRGVTCGLPSDELAKCV